MTLRFDMELNINIPLTLQLISTAIMIIGIAFGIQNIRQYQAMRKRESAIMMLNSFQTMDFVKGFLHIVDLPEKAGKTELDNLPPDQFLAIYMVMGTWERLGILVYRREIELELVDDAFSGMIIQSWQKLEPYIKEMRAHIQREMTMEWFQWLAERIMERAKDTQSIPAYVAHRDWKMKG